MSKICVTVTDEAYTEGGDILECRWDLLDSEASLKIVREDPRPKILTLRSVAHGGAYSGPIEKLLELARLQPDYLDVEFPQSVSLIPAIRQIAPKTKILLSSHSGPVCLETRWAELRKVEADIYKMALPVRSSVETLRLLSFAKTAQKQAPLVLIGVGELGGASRILAPKVGMPFTFAYPEGGSPAAPGQLSVNELRDLYGYYRINEKTQPTALIGNPVAGSIGHHCHNRIIQDMGLNSTYLKFLVQEAELEAFLALSIELDFRGLSVTMPFKESILPYLEGGDVSAGAVNTLSLDERQWVGDNTDGLGAAQSLPPVKDRQVLLLGAGGAARGIAQKMQEQGAWLQVWNRHTHRAKALVEALGGECLEELPKSCDILISTLPPEAPLPEVEAREFLNINLREGGEEMFLYQAVAQVRRWWGLEDKGRLPEAMTGEVARWLSM